MSKPNRQNISEFVQRILIQTFKIEKALIKNESLLKDDLGLDSVDLLDLVGLVEKEFSVKLIDSNSFREKWPLSVNDLIGLIGEHMEKQS